MSVIILLIFFSMIVASGFLFAFIWAVKSGQFDDKYTPSVRILFDNEHAVKGNSKENVKFRKHKGENDLRNEIPDNKTQNSSILEEMK